MDPNLWKAQLTRIQDVYNSATISSPNQFIDIQGNLTAIAGNLVTGQNVLTDALARQDITYNIVSTEADRLQNKKSSVDNAYASTQRMIQLNNNYQKRYWDYTKIIIVWTGVLALYLIMNLLQKYFPIIPSILVDILILIAVITAAVYSFTIYYNLRNFDLMNYGQINPAPPVVSKDQSETNEKNLKNQIQSAQSGNLPTDPNQLNCLQNGLFYNTVNGLTKCYSYPGTGASLDSNMAGNIITLGSSSTIVNLKQGFQNIQANGEYEFNDYVSYK
jgi:hypothetical protein